MPLPGRLLFDLVALFRRNSLLRGELVVLGRRADLGRLAGLPLLAVTTVRDHVVPPASTTALASVPGLSVELLQCRAGLVAMLAGREGQTALYPGLASWLDAHDPVSAAGVPASRQASAGARPGRPPLPA
ncbi:MAG: hypothetical protein JWO60_1157 [Frankiales bacterium]|nr:hypothetical protein [Frankiales bacterium]